MLQANPLMVPFSANTSNLHCILTWFHCDVDKMIKLNQDHIFHSFIFTFFQAACSPAMDAVVFTYTLCAAYIKSGTYDNLVLAINELNSIPPNMVSRLPAIKYLLAAACHKLNRYLKENWLSIRKETLVNWLANISLNYWSSKEKCTFLFQNLSR